MTERIFTTEGKIFISCNKDCGEKHWASFIYPVHVRAVDNKGFGAPCCVEPNTIDQLGNTRHQPIGWLRVCSIKTKEMNLKFEYEENDWSKDK